MIHHFKPYNGIIFAVSFGNADSVPAFLTGAGRIQEGAF